MGLEKINHILDVEVTRFALVGAVNFVLTFIAFSVMMQGMGINYLISLTVAWVVGLVFSYVSNFLWVFLPKKVFRFKTGFLRYFIASITSLVGNGLILKFIVEHNGSDPFYVQLALIPGVAMFNYITAKYWSLRLHSASI